MTNRTSFKLRRAAAPAVGLLALAASLLAAPETAQGTTAAVPSTPTSLTVNGSAHHGTWLTWAGAADGFVVQRATNSGFTSGSYTDTLRGPGHQLSPPGLADGTRYYFRVRATTNGSTSPWSTTVSAVPSSHHTAVRVGTYNVLEDFMDGTTENGNTVAPWTQRRAGVVSGILASGASILGVQEAAGWVGTPCTSGHVGTRQIDDIVSRLGSHWALAKTEVTPCLSGYYRTGVYVIYDKTRFSAVGSGGHWNIGTSSSPRWATYQELRSLTTGGEVLFVTPHLIVGGGSTYDRERQTETTAMINDATSAAAALGSLPIVYAGDYNSHELHPLDGPAVAMRAAHATDADVVAQRLVNATYNSFNGLDRTPPADGHSVDHVYVGPGVALKSWDLVLSLSGGRFVGVIPSDHDLLVSDISYPY